MFSVAVSATQFIHNVVYVLLDDKRRVRRVASDGNHFEPLDSVAREGALAGLAGLLPNVVTIEKPSVRPGGFFLYFFDNGG